VTTAAPAQDPADHAGGHHDERERHPEQRQGEEGGHGDGDQGGAGERAPADALHRLHHDGEDRRCEAREQRRHHDGRPERDVDG